MRPSSFNRVSLEENKHLMQDDFQRTTQFQFDYVARKTLIRSKSNYRRSRGRRYNHEALFSEISNIDLKMLPIFDTYHLDSQMYQVLSFNVEVRNNKIAKALDMLPERKRNTILMFYYLGMSDVEISNELKVNRSTVYRNRHSALENVKTLLEEEL
ncbi:sigma factor-like helix-turn-helix DNA-binding protein [Sporolactobacillus pectinivorans]|uniref:sigma factor-like helix-turn-helix DNA-binding protein n=1 Tax=Sporolactobacillus pectinivorans TaxID=1591408 RepID=UPI000C269072|nr:sigma factor-like helix-turn-helix DNA-binding protein [Sporolactobacillus pectinivorans]